MTLGMEDDTRTRILDVALSLFVAEGFAATRTGDICKRAGISNGSLFHFFPTKEAIAVALYVEAIASYQSALIAALERGSTPAAALRGIVTAQCAWVQNEEQRARFLFAQGAPDWSPEAAAAVGALNSRFRDSIEIWRALPAQRRVLRKLTFETFTAILLGPSLMSIRQWLRAGSVGPADQVNIFADAAVRSLLKE